MRQIAWLFVGVVLVTVLTGVRDVKVLPGIQAEVPSLAGTYRLEGTNPDGRAYDGIVAITAIGPIWAMRWIAGEPAMGYGIFREKEKVLSVVFRADAGGDIGLATYIVSGKTGKRRLTGRWIFPPADVVGTETLIETSAPIPTLPTSPPSQPRPNHPQIGV